MVATRAVMLPERDELAQSPPTSPITSTDTWLTLLGGFALQLGCRTASLPPGSQRLVAFLGLHDTAVDRGYVSGVLWADSSEAHAHGSLRSTLWKLRADCPGLVECRGDTLMLDPGVDVDVRRVSLLARALVAGCFEEETVALLEPRFTCELLPGWYDEWVLVERERHRHLSLHALEALCEHLTATGRYGAAVLAGLAAVDREPLRESSHRALMKAHLAEGNAVEAIRRYRQYETLVSRELNCRPSAAMRSLLDGIVTV
jgi:DNA-binding SARP family transcriptional activator